MVTKLVRAANKQQASRPGADPTSIMEKEGIACENITAPSTTGGPEIPIRVYRPEEGEGLPLLIYLHGGGWVLGGTNGGKDNGGHDGICCRFAAKLKCAVALVDYRKAPVHKFPAAPDDCLDVLRFAVSEAGAAKLRIDRSNVAIGGDSAGGNLSCVLAHDALAAGIQIKHQLLVYPVTSARVHWCVPAPLTNRLTHLSSAPPRKPAACHSAQTWFWFAFTAGSSRGERTRTSRSSLRARCCGSGGSIWRATRTRPTPAPRRWRQPRKLGKLPLRSVSERQPCAQALRLV